MSADNPPPTERHVLDYLTGRIAVYQGRLGRFDFEKHESHMGRRAVSSYWVDGEPRDLRVPSFSLVELRRLSYRTHGRPWFTARATVTAQGTFTCDYEYDRPPTDEVLRTAPNYVADLEIYPRPRAGPGVDEGGAGGGRSLGPALRRAGMEGPRAHGGAADSRVRGHRAAAGC